jgi:hypothetical protein
VNPAEPSTRITQNFRGSVADEQRVRQTPVRNPQLVALYQESIISILKKSTRRLLQQADASRRSCQPVLQDLRSKPYRITEVHELRLGEAHMHVRCCGWLLETVTAIGGPIALFHDRQILVLSK